MRRLLIIPGRGDNVHMFRAGLPIWLALGFRPSVFNFRFLQDDGDYDGRFARLGAYIQREGPLSIVGFSAGGIVALDALFVWPTKVQRVAMVATPLVCTRSGNTVVENGIARLQHHRATVKPGQLRGVCQYTCRHDKVVRLSDSVYPFISYAGTLGWSHNSAIALAATVLAPRLAMWLHGW